jgi:DNA anti-recombination protein RmuC
MQKAFSLQPEETQHAKQLEEEQRNLLAQLGSMGLQKKAINKRLPQIEEEQRKLVRGVVSRVGVEQFSAARIDGTNLLIEIPDAPAPAPAPALPVPIDGGKPNGSAANIEN